GLHACRRPGCARRRRIGAAPSTRCGHRDRIGVDGLHRGRDRRPRFAGRSRRRRGSDRCIGGLRHRLLTVGIQRFSNVRRLVLCASRTPAGALAARAGGTSMTLGKLGPILPYAVFAVILAVLPYVFDAPPFLTVSAAVQIVIMSIATLGLVLLMGQAGQISIGQAAFFGIGAFSSAILTTRWEIAPLWACVVGMVIAGVIAWVV